MSAQAPDPPASPAAMLRLRADPPRVMRLSRKALTLMGGAATLVVGAALIYALQTPKDDAPAELYSTDGRSTAEGLNTVPKDYGEVPQLGPPLPGDLGRPILSAQQRGVDVAPPPMGTGAPSDPQAARQAREAARTSGLFVGAGGRAASASPIPTFSLPGPPGLEIAAPAAIAPAGDTTPSGQTAKRAFLAAASPGSTSASGRLTPPLSPYVLQAGAVIAAALITGVRSDLPGPITAQVTQNVYDSPTGHILLIPQGARLLGTYDSEVSFGQTRVLLAWDRLILPDGRTITLDRQPAIDAAGQAGLQDETDEHWGAMARAALLSTLLGVGAELGSDSDDSLVRALRRGTQDTINQTGQQVVRRQLNVQPTLTLRPGLPLRVLVTRDLILPPAKMEMQP